MCEYEECIPKIAVLPDHPLTPVRLRKLTCAVGMPDAVSNAGMRRSPSSFALVKKIGSPDGVIIEE